MTVKYQEDDLRNFVNCFMVCIKAIMFYLENQLEEIPEEVRDGLEWMMEFHDHVKDEVLQSVTAGKDFPHIRKFIKGDESRETLEGLFYEDAALFIERYNLDVAMYLGTDAMNESLAILNRLAGRAA